MLTRDINCLTVSAYFIESGRLFQSLGAAIENALSLYVVVDDLGTINSLLVVERKAQEKFDSEIFYSTYQTYRIVVTYN